MIRTLLIVLALVVLAAAGLFYMGVLNWPGAGQPVEVRPVDVKMETRQVNVQVPVVTTNTAQPTTEVQVQPPIQVQTQPPAQTPPANGQ